jgi:translocator assembly and maintenance protein 41
MLDLIFAVDDPLAWHNENLRRNPQHYTLWAPLIGGSGLCAIQSRAAQIYYNAHWPSLKYGIISTQCLIDDLRHWNTLYVAGRMHKPIMCLKQNQSVADAAKVNLQSAFCAALLTLPARFTDLELFTSIAGLSYAGDVRFRIGFENPNKVRNLVQPHVSTFRELYRPYFSQFLPSCPPSVSSPAPLSHLFPWSCEIAMHVQTQPTTDTLNLEACFCFDFVDHFLIRLIFFLYL